MPGMHFYIGRLGPSRGEKSRIRHPRTFRCKLWAKETAKHQTNEASEGSQSREVPYGSSPCVLHVGLLTNMLGMVAQWRTT